MKIYKNRDSRATRCVVSSLGLLLCTATAFAGNSSDVEERVLPVQQAISLKARVIEADITVRTHDDATVRLLIHRTVKDLSDAATDQAMQALKTEFKVQGDTVILNEDFPNNAGEWKKTTGHKKVDFSIQYELWVPDSFNLDLKTVDGDLVAEGVAGQCKLTTVDGDIFVKDSRGALDAQTVDGDIMIGGSTTIQAQTVDGDIMVDLAGQPAVDCRLNTTDGDVQLNLDPAVAVKILGQTLDGDLEIGLPLENKASTGGQVIGTRNGGGPQILMNSIDGDIILKGLSK